MKRGPCITTNPANEHERCELCEEYDAPLRPKAVCTLGIGAISLRRIYMLVCADCMRELVDALQVGLFKFVGDPLRGGGR